MRLVEPSGNDILIACPDGEWFLAMDIVVALIHRPGVNDLTGRGYYFECTTEEMGALDRLADKCDSVNAMVYRSSMLRTTREYRGLPVKLRA